MLKCNIHNILQYFTLRVYETRFRHNETRLECSFASVKRVSTSVSAEVVATAHVAGGAAVAAVARGAVALVQSGQAAPRAPFDVFLDEAPSLEEADGVAVLLRALDAQLPCACGALATATLENDFRQKTSDSFR